MLNLFLMSGFSRYASGIEFFPYGPRNSADILKTVTSAKRIKMHYWSLSIIRVIFQVYLVTFSVDQHRMLL